MPIRDPSQLSALSVKNRRKAWRRREDRQLLQRELELDAARSICRALFQQLTVEDIVAQILHTALEVVGAEAGSVLLADPATKQLVFRHVIGEKAERLKGKFIPWGKGIAGAVYQSGEPSLVPDASLDQRHHSAVDMLTGYKTRDMFTLPLKRWGGEPIGVLQILNKTEGRLDENDLAILTIISAFSAQAIEQARHFETARTAPCPQCGAPTSKA